MISIGMSHKLRMTQSHQIMVYINVAFVVLLFHTASKLIVPLYHHIYYMI
jgi:hypothetical protein